MVSCHLTVRAPKPGQGTVVHTLHMVHVVHIFHVLSSKIQQKNTLHYNIEPPKKSIYKKFKQKCMVETEKTSFD